jgi:hypothetical protein
VEVDTKLGPAETGKFTFTGDSDRSVADVLRAARDSSDDQTDRDEAAAWLKDYMKSKGGEATASDAIKEAEKHGISKTTLTRARQRAKVKSVKSGMSGGWVWSLEESTEETEETRNQKVNSSDSSVNSLGDPNAPCLVCNVPIGTLNAIQGRTVHRDCEVTDDV